jgi:hypothetical protein
LFKVDAGIFIQRITGAGDQAERAQATIVESPGNHAIYVSTPDAVARLIEEAATATP